jgi:hypothetical protein
MIFVDPLPYEEAIASRVVRTLLPNELRTGVLQTIRPEILARARFSAGVVEAEWLQRAFDGIDAVADGKRDRASVRAELKQLLEALDYRPVEDDEGTIKDLRTDGRLNLIIDTNIELMMGAGRHLQAQEPTVRDQWPAKELYRALDREEPRDWHQLWRDAATDVGDEAALAALDDHDRMVARRDSRIWYALSRFGVPYAPYDYNSGMRDRLVSRRDAIDVGVIDRDTQIAADDLDINQDLQASPDVRAKSLRDELARELAGVAEWSGDVLRLIGGNP